MDLFPNIHKFAYYYCDKDWYWNTVANPNWPSPQYFTDDGRYYWNYNFWCILSGEGNLKAKGKDWPLRRGDVFLLRSDEVYNGSHNSEKPLVVASAHFDFIDSQGCITTPEMPFTNHINNMQFLEIILKRIEVALHSSNPELAKIWMQASLAEFMNADTHREPRLNSHNTKIEEICNEIRRRPSRQYDLDQLAKQLNCSQRHFNRLFKGFMGVAPKEYIQEKRLETAKDMLLSSSLPIGRVAELVGFADIYYFSKWFKAQTGLSPSQYRQ